MEIPLSAVYSLLAAFFSKTKKVPDLPSLSLAVKADGGKSITGRNAGSADTLKKYVKK